MSVPRAPLGSTLERMERSSNLLGLGLALLSWGLLLAGWVVPWFIPIGPRQVVHVFGFSLGGMVSVPTFLLCVYYIWIRALRTSSVKVAALLSGSYMALFGVFLVALLFRSALALAYALF